MQNSDATWFTVYTKPRQEDTALDNLVRQSFDCFLPLAINPYQRRTKKKPKIEPLFPRYLFLKVYPGEQSLGPIKSTTGVSNLVRFGTQLATVPESVIQFIRNRCDKKTGLVQLQPIPVNVGDKVRVFDGPLAGMEGIFSARKGIDRALLLMEFLGTACTVEVDSLLLRKIK